MTMVEVLAVVVILGLVASLLTVSFRGAFAKGKRELARTGIGVIVAKLELYHMENNAWPPNDIGLAALTDGRADPSAAFYLSRDKLLDPWSQPYQYVSPGPAGHPYEVLALGQDHAVGGVGDDADISSIDLRADEGSQRR
jgi:general secretion pathway protein G